MKQILKKLVKQKTKINIDNGRMENNIEVNDGELNKFNREIKSTRRVIRNTKKKKKSYEDLSLRISELKNSIIHYENDVYVLKNRIVEFENLKNIIIIEIKSIKQNVKDMKHNGVRGDFCKSEIHRVSYCRHLKSKKRLKKISQIKYLFLERIQ